MKRVRVPQELKSVLRVLTDRSNELDVLVLALSTKEVLVGFPQETADRDAQPGEPITNAALGYIHDNGMPEQNIPARPFMIPGIEEAKDKVEKALTSGAKGVIRGEAFDKSLHRAGIVASTSIKKKINEGIPPPLAESTLWGRVRKGRKGAMWELAWREAGAPAGTELAKPLIDTAQMRNAVTYVIRRRRR